MNQGGGTFDFKGIKNTQIFARSALQHGFRRIYTDYLFCILSDNSLRSFYTDRADLHGSG